MSREIESSCTIKSQSLKQCQYKSHFNCNVATTTIYHYRLRLYDEKGISIEIVKTMNSEEINILKNTINYKLLYLALQENILSKANVLFQQILRLD